MTYKLPAETLKRLYAAMLAPLPHRIPSPSVAWRTQKLAGSGWVMSHQAEDLLLDADVRLHDHSDGDILVDLSRAFWIPVQHICRRPRAVARGVVLFEAWATLDFAHLLIVLEMLGFNVDPSGLVAEMLPGLPKKGFISSSAFEVVQHARYRWKSSIAIGREDTTKIVSFKEDRLALGYKACTWLDESGDPVSITVYGPKYRRRPPTVPVNCECGVTWERGDPESSLEHRKEHKLRMGYLQPGEHPMVLAERAAGAFDEHVDMLSARWRQDEMYNRALAFKREEHYDFVQWSTSEDDPNCHGFLFADAGGRIVGACAFRLRLYKDAPRRWGLQWVWVAPAHRRQGHLQARWSTFKQRFGDFDVEGPVSDQMQEFLRRAGDEHLMDYRRTSISLGEQRIVGGGLY